MTGGTVFDIGYRNYTGAREGRGRAIRAVYKDGIRIALGLGRGGRAKVLPWFFIALMAAIGLIMAIVAGAAVLMAGPDAVEKLSLPTHSDYYAFASIITFVFAAVIGPELLCPDRREGTIQLYLVRPLSAGDYVAGRWAAFLTVMCAACWLPQVILFLGLAGGATQPLDYVQAHWIDVPRFLLAGLVMAVYVTTLSLMVASFTTRRAYAAVFMVGLFAILAPFTFGVAQEMPSGPGEWVSMFNLTNIPLHVVDAIFRSTTELTKDAPAHDLGSTMHVAWYAAWVIIPGMVLYSRYRRLTA